MAEQQSGAVQVGLSAADYQSVKSQLNQIYSRFKNREKRVKTAMVSAVNRVGKKIRTSVSKRIRAKINIKKEDIDGKIRLTKAVSGNLPTAVVTLSKTSRLSLKYFGARQTAKGVSYKIEKAGGRKIILGAFGPEIPRLGNHVWKRVGAKRLPIVKLFGPSPWGVFVKSGMLSETTADAKSLLRKELTEQIRVAMLRASGTIQ